jgi:hypothetical protein
MTSPESPGTPSRPAVPEYGEYAEPDDPRIIPAYRFAPPPTPPAAAPRTRDAFASSLLLGVGFVITVYMVLFAFDLEVSMQRVFTAYGGTGDYEPAANLPLARWVIIASHVILLAAAILLTRARVRAGKLAVWVPLAAGAIAAVIFFSTFAVVLMSDQVLLETATEYFGR